MFDQIAQHLGPLLSQLLLLATGSVGLWGATAAVKSVNAIPISEGQTARIRIFLAVISTLSVLVGHALEHNLAPKDVQDVAVMALQALLMAVGAHALHQTAKTTPENGG